MTARALADDFFRHQYGRLVATLTRKVGAHRIDLVEDAVQSALMSALDAWTVGGVPVNPSAWLYRAAWNALAGELRQESRRNAILEAQAGSAACISDDPGVPLLASEDVDDLLHLLFVCCDAAIPLQSQLVLALKTLCGFDVREIAHRLFLNEATVYKRLERARTRLRAIAVQPDALSADEYQARRPAVLTILYVLFTEGYLSSHPEMSVRREHCREAIRLTTLLASHPAGQVPETFALLALMHLHHARLASRHDASGTLLLLEEQDRAAWDRDEMQVGFAWLARSAQGEVFTRYHAEAAIAAEHCLAPTFEATRWDRVVANYALLERSAPSAIHTLGRAVAVAEWIGPAAALGILQAAAPPGWLGESYLWSTVLADLHRRCGHAVDAEAFRQRAHARAPTEAVRQLLERRFASSGHARGGRGSCALE